MVPFRDGSSLQHLTKGSPVSVLSVTSEQTACETMPPYKAQGTLPTQLLQGKIIFYKDANVPPPDFLPLLPQVLSGSWEQRPQAPSSWVPLLLLFKSRVPLSGFQ